MKVLMLTGGIESTVLAFGIRPDACLTIDYGQPCFQGEKKAASNICELLGLPHVVQQAKYRHSRPNVEDRSYWPLRNQALATIAAARFFDLEDLEIIFGFTKDDIYPDCTDTFVEIMNNLLRIQHSGIKILAPASHLTTLELLRSQEFPPEKLGLTFSCHYSDFPCGVCKGCQKNLSTCRVYKAQSKIHLVDD